MSSFTYITKQHQLDLAVSQMSSASELGVDIETSGYYTYTHDVCLIQFSAGDFHYVVDTLVGLDLASIGRLFADPTLVKIFHGAASDIAELRAGTDWDFANVFDTLFCCRLLTHESCALGSLTARYFDAPLEKKEQKSNWKKRPLTRSQLEYAHRDTIYLARLKQVLLEQVPEQLLPEMQAEFDWMCRTSHNQGRVLDPQRWVRIPGAIELKPEERGALAALLEVREERAAKDNIAAFRLLTNESMLKLARLRPQSADDLRTAGVVNPRMLRKDGDRIIAAIRGAQPIADSELPQPKEMPADVMERVRRLKKWRKGMAEFRGLDISLVVSNRILEQLAETMPETPRDLAELGLLNEWKLEHYAADLLRVLREPYGGRLNRDVPRLEVADTVS